MPDPKTGELRGKFVTTNEDGEEKECNISTVALHKMLLAMAPQAESRAGIRLNQEI